MEVSPMKLKRNLRLAMSALLSVAAIALLSGKIIAQDSRPRYSSAQSAERGWTLPPDTVISVQMNGTLSSRTARVGDKFTATVTVPVYLNGQTVIPAGSIVEGRVTQVTPAKRMNRSGTIGIDFDALVFPDGSAVNLVGSLTSADPDTQRRIDDESRVSSRRNDRAAVFIGGGGAIGAVLGGIAGGGKGAVLGGVAGAGAGVAAILLSKGEEAEVPSGTPFGVQIKQALVIRESSVSQTGPEPGDRSSDQPLDRPAERSGRPDAVGPQPEIPNRQVPNRTEPEPRPEIRNDADRPSADVAALPLSAPEMVRRAQGALKEQGYYEGEADGVMNSRTSSSLRAYQREHKLQETGDLDPQTARSLGIMGASAVSDRTTDRRRENRTESAASPEAVMANVLSASANRMQDGAISISISTQANSGGWRWIGEHVVNGDTLEVYARAIRPTGMVTQVLTRGRIELTVRDGVQYVRRVVIHSASGDQMIALGGRTETLAEPAAASGASGASGMGASSTTASSAGSLQRKAEELLSEYQRLYGVRMTGTGVEVDNASQYREAEIELLFAIDSFVNSAQLYARFAMSFRDRESMRGATLAMARQARRTDRVLSTATTRAADSLATRWDSIRQDVLRLMQSYNIGSSEIEN
jgi:peptidoglycan hydrolase-like protein with peptidoglycan-binding domain